MVFLTPTDALGSHAHAVRDLLIEVVRTRHDRAAEAHLASESRYSMGFGSQWRDLLDDAHLALTSRGYQSYKLAPAGYELPVVNDCLIYVWRVTGAPDAVSEFASSSTRQNSFSAQPPDPMLFEPGFGDEPDEAIEDGRESKVGRLVKDVGDTMPVVLVLVHSSPHHLQAIEWAVAEFDETTGEVKLSGHEAIWEPAVVVDGVAPVVEPFDSGIPVAPAVELRAQEGTAPDAG